MAEEFSFDDQINLMARLQQEISTDEKSISDVVMRIKTAKHYYSNLDEQIRAEALRYMNETGDKKPHEACWIRFSEVRMFDPDKIRDAVLQNPRYAQIRTDRTEEALELLAKFAPDLLEPNIKLIEKDFKKGTSLFDYELVNVPTVFVKTKLGEYVKDDDSW